MADALETNNLKETYGGGVETLWEIDPSVKEGDFYALLGPSETGKSITIGIITFLVNKTSGKVDVFGYDLDRDLVRAKRQVELVPQGFNFSPFETARQIVVNQTSYYGVSHKEAIEHSEKYLRQSNLWEGRNVRARMLFGGMKRKLMTARVLMHEPRLLTLDEPTAGVDIELRREMWEFLRELNENGTTIILTTYYLEEVEMLCCNIGITQSGELIGNTSMRELLLKLQFETFIFDLVPCDIKSVVEGYACTFGDEQTVAIEVERNQGVNGIFDQLIKQGIKVLSMRNKSNRLKELFLKITEKNNHTEGKSVQSLFYCIKKFGRQGNEPLFAYMSPNTGSVSDHDILVFYYFRKNNRWADR